MAPAEPINTRTWRELLVENSLDAVVAIDEESTVVDWNAQAEKIFGRTKDEVLGKDIGPILIPREFREGHRKGIVRYLTTGVGPILNKRIELEALHASGVKIPVELTVAPVENEGKILFYSFIRDISERRSLETTRDSQRRRLKEMFMDAPTAISIRRGPELVFELANTTYLQLIGKTEEEVLGKKFEEVFPPHTQSEFQRQFKEVYRTGRVFYANEVPIAPRAGSGVPLRYFNFVIQPLYEKGQVDGIIIFGNDVTPVVRARKAAEESELQLRLIMDSSPAFIAAVDRDFRYQFVNKHYETFFGIDVEAIRGKHVAEVIGKKEFEAVLPHYEKAFAGVSSQVDLRLTSPSGASSYVELKYVPFKPADAVEGLIIIGHDITERKSDEDDQKLLADLTSFYATHTDEAELIAKTTELLAKRLNVSRCWIAESNEETSTSVVRRDYARGLPSLAGTYDLKAFGPELLEDWRSGKIVTVTDVTTDPRTRAHAQGHLALGIRSFITVPLHRDGRLEAQLDISAEEVREWTENEKELARAVGESLWYTLENNKLLAELKEAVRARDEFISVCSHELKTPVTSMKLQFQMAERQFQKNDDRVFERKVVEKRIHTSNRQLDRMSKLIEDMLDVSRLSSGRIVLEKQRLEVNALVEEVVDRFAEQFELSKIACSFTRGPEEGWVIGDRYRLEQVVSNLLTNALKYGEGKPVEVRVSTSPRSVVISVRDQGMGIAQENLDRIFQRYERAIDATNISGLGLGLYISHQIVEGHKGRIDVESAHRRGSTFSVELPRVDVEKISRV